MHEVSKPLGLPVPHRSSDPGPDGVFAAYAILLSAVATRVMIQAQCVPWVCA
jgi:hypothetical protein